MKVLFIKSHIHHKNINFILKCKKINFTIVDWVNNIDNLDLSSYDCVYSPCDPIDVSKYPNTKFIFGPQFSIFPEHKLDLIKSNNSVYNLLSDWVINIWSKYSLCNNLRLIKMPFGVDSDKFIDKIPIIDRNKVMVYFKHRDPNDLLLVEKFLKQKNVNYTIFSYDSRYDENYYINYLQDTKFCIWVDAHESQGFALQEALSCNVPLLVWNVKSMNQEFGSSYSNLESTTIPYWDENCGEVFYNFSELEEKYNKFINNLENFKPREFILNNLSIEVCENKLIELINNI